LKTQSHLVKAIFKSSPKVGELLKKLLLAR